MAKFLLANWKCNKTLGEAHEWLDVFCRLFCPAPDLQVIIAPPAPYLVPMRAQLDSHGLQAVGLAAQDLSPFPPGAYTGAVAAPMLRGLADYAILGHSERRRHFHETVQDVADKVGEALEAGIRPVVCVDRPYARAQLAALAAADLEKVIIGYGPVEAVGREIPHSPQWARAGIKEVLALAPGVPLLYGGSVTGDNAAGFLELPGIAGLMTASAGLDPAEFVRICSMM